MQDNSRVSENPDALDPTAQPQASEPVFKPVKAEIDESGKAVKKPAPANAGYFPERQFRKKRGSFALLDNVLSKVVSKMGLDRKLKEHAFMGLWPVIVGDFFAQKSRPLFIDSENVLVVTVKDASVGQELSLMKRDITRKLRQSAQGLGITINGVRFDLKNFHNERMESERLMVNRVIARPEPSDVELKDVVLDEVDLMQLSHLAEEMRTNTDPGVGISAELNLSERMLVLCERELRLKKWRISHDFPKCKDCGNAAAMLYGPKELCVECFSTPFGGC